MNLSEGRRNNNEDELCYIRRVLCRYKEYVKNKLEPQLVHRSDECHRLHVELSQVKTELIVSTKRSIDLDKQLQVSIQELTLMAKKMVDQESETKVKFQKEVNLINEKCSGFAAQGTEVKTLKAHVDQLEKIVEQRDKEVRELRLTVQQHHEERKTNQSRATFTASQQTPHKELHSSPLKDQYYNVHQQPQRGSSNSNALQQPTTMNPNEIQSFHSSTMLATSALVDDATVFHAALKTSLDRVGIDHILVLSQWENFGVNISHILKHAADDEEVFNKQSHIPDDGNRNQHVNSGPSTKYHISIVSDIVQQVRVALDVERRATAAAMTELFSRHAALTETSNVVHANGDRRLDTLQQLFQQRLEEMEEDRREEKEGLLHRLETERLERATDSLRGDQNSTSGHTHHNNKSARWTPMRVVGGHHHQVSTTVCSSLVQTTLDINVLLASNPTTPHQLVLRLEAEIMRLEGENNSLRELHHAMEKQRVRFLSFVNVRGDEGGVIAGATSLLQLTRGGIF